MIYPVRRCESDWRCGGGREARERADAYKASLRNGRSSDWLLIHAEECESVRRMARSVTNIPNMIKTRRRLTPHELSVRV